MMHSLYIALLIFTLAGCSKWKRDNDPKDPTTTTEHVEAKADVYVAHEGEAADAFGFYHGKCDSLMFTTLRAVATNRAQRDVILKAMGDEPGRWYRHAKHDCYEKGESASDISGDMLLALAVYAWHFGDVEIVQGVIAYGKAHNWTMGGGDPLRTIMRPTLIATYYDMARELGSDQGEPPAQLTSESETYCGWTGHTHDVCPANLQGSADAMPSGFEAHLQVLHTMLRALVLGGASDQNLDTLRAQAGRQARNALFQAAYHVFADGDQTAAMAVLADDALFPVDRLPTVADRCTEYLFQRDDTPGDWGPCEKDAKPHSGTDLLVALAVAKNKVRSQ